MAAISLPQLSLIPNVSTLLNGIIQVTGLQSAIDAAEQINNLVKAGDFTPATIDRLLTNLKSLLATVGQYVPGGAFANLEAEIAKFETVAAAIEAGQPTDVADVTYTSRSGQKFDLSLSLTVKQEAAPVAEVPVA